MMQTIFTRGSEIKKVHINEVEDMLMAKGICIDTLFGDDDYMYVSTGFMNGLYAEENESGEWHHYFKKDATGFFDAFKMSFA